MLDFPLWQARAGSRFEIPRGVPALKFYRFAFSLLLLSASVSSLLAQSNPIPAINGPVSPQAVAPGGAGFALTVRGANFVPGAVVNWNGSGRSTTFISGSQLRAQILASDVALAGSSLITVTNPPPGGGLSSSSFGIVEIHQPVASMMLTQPKKYMGPLGLSQLYTADLNGDSKQDLVVLDAGVSVLIANGDGTFTKFPPLALSNSPYGLSFGDFNGDGKEDFAFTIPNRGLAFVALGDGTGKFKTSRGFGNLGDPSETVAGDFNRDGNLDLVVLNYGATGQGLYILLGNGDGTFQPQQAFSSIVYATNLTAADFNGDGILDLALLDGSNGMVAVLLGNGDGTFQPQIETQQGFGQDLLSDFNGDGKLDFVIVGSGMTPIAIGVLLGNGDGTFQAPQFYSTGFNGESPFLITGDFNSDGSADVFSYGNQVFLGGFLAGKGDGTFQRVRRLTVPGPVFKLFSVVGDFNSDGLLDFAVGLKNGSEVFLQAPQ